MLTAQSSVKEVEQELRSRGIQLQGSVGGEDYAIDRHFERFCFDEFETVKDVLKFCDHLESECEGCAKAFVLRSWLEKPFWSDSIQRARVALSSCRRYACQNHESGSYHREHHWWEK